MRQPFTHLLAICIGVLLLVTGCLKPLVTGSPYAPAIGGRSIASQNAIAPLVGSVESVPYRTQAATIADIAKGSTVSLIDTTTNHTISTTVTDDTGAFRIVFTSSFQPTSADLFYLEAYKGLPAGGEPNRAGISMARVRTLIRFEGGAWRHLHDTQGIRISTSSTALSVIASLRSASESTQIDPGLLLGSLVTVGTGDSFNPGTSGVASSEFQTVRSQVAQCLAGDQDPLYRITYDVSSRAYFLVDKGIEISSVAPLSGPIGSTVTIQGSNLGTTPIVRFNGATATASVNGVSSVITTAVPPGATSGPLTVQVGDIVFNGAVFAVSPWDGHNVFDAANNMYVSSSHDNRIYRFAPNGTVSLYSNDPLLNYPRGLVVDPQGNVYVANWNNKNILKIEAGTRAVSIYASGGGLDRPLGMAMNAAGDLFVANYYANNLLKIASGSATPTVFATSPDFKNPHGVAFDSQGYLYASNWSGGTVLKIAPDGTVAPYAAGFSNPGTLAFDSRDNLYIPCYGTHNVFKITPQGGYSTFTSISSYPSSAAMNPDGTLYVGSYYGHIAKVDPQARITGYLSSGHLTWSLKANPANNDLYVASGFGWGYRTKAIYRMAYNAGAPDYDYYDPPTPVIKDLPNPSAIDYVDPTTMYVGDWDGFIFRANPTTGAYTTYAANLSSIADLTHDSAGDLYAAGWYDHSIYRFSGNSLVQRYSRFWYLSNATFGPDGHMYVPDHWQHKVLRVSPAGVITTYSDNGGAGFSSPHGVTFDTSGNLYVSSFGNDRIYKVATGSLDVTTYATGMSDPSGMAFDGAGNLFVSNYGDSTVKKVAAGTGVVSNFATGLNSPRGLAINPADGTLYAPAWNGDVYKITSGGVKSTYASGLGNCMQAFLDTDGSLLVASYGNRTIYVIPPGGGAPSRSYGLPIRIGGVVKDAAGNMYALTWDAPNIYRFNSGSSTYSLWAAGVRTPAGLTLDPAQTHLYVTDWDNGVVNKINLTTGAISIAANSSHWIGSQDELKGITLSDGKLYVSSWDNGVWQLDPGLINSSNNAGVVRYGNNSSTNKLRGGIAFGANNNLYGTTYEYSLYDSAPVSRIPLGATSGGGGNATSLKNFPNRIGF